MRTVHYIISNMHIHICTYRRPAGGAVSNGGTAEAGGGGRAAAKVRSTACTVQDTVLHLYIRFKTILGVG